MVLRPSTANPDDIGVAVAQQQLFDPIRRGFGIIVDKGHDVADTKYQEEGWPKFGFETQVNNTHKDWKKTGSLYDVVNVKESAATDNKWWTQHIIVKGNKVTVKIDGQTVLEYYEPPGAVAGKDFERKLGSGTFAFQAHDPKSVIRYKNVRVKRLD